MMMRRQYILLSDWRVRCHRHLLPRQRPQQQQQPPPQLSWSMSEINCADRSASWPFVTAPDVNKPQRALHFFLNSSLQLLFRLSVNIS